MIRPRRLITVVALVATLSTGCGLLPPPTPDWVTGRIQLPSCGSEELSAARPPNREARECLMDAWRESREAELSTTMTTIEGDPVSRITRVFADGSVEVFVDATRDRFGSGEWERLICTGLRPVRAEDGLDDAWVFVEEGCGTPEPDL